MKKNLVLFILLFISITSYAQTVTMTTSSVSFVEKSAKGGFGKWSDFIDAKVLITIDAKKDRIVVNSPTMQLFTITYYGAKVENDTDKIVPFECVDNNGSKCKILVVTRKKEGDRMQFYINYSEVKFVYNIYN